MQKDRIEQNIEAIKLNVYEKWFVLESSHKRANIPQKLVIEKNPGKIYEIPKHEEICQKLEKTLNYSIFLGIITIMKRVFLVFG